MKQENCSSTKPSSIKPKNGRVRRRPRHNKAILKNVDQKIYNSLIDMGFDNNQATQMCKKLSESQAKKNFQRKEENTKNFSNADPKIKSPLPEVKIEKIPIEQTVFSKIDGPVIVNIAETNYPDVFLSLQQKSIIQNEIMETLLEQEDKDVKPQFRGCSNKPGWLSITCGNQETAIWLINKIPEISRNTKINLKELKETLNPELVIVYFPQSLGESTSKILRRISAQNFDLMISSWKILKRKTVSNMVQLTILVDAESIKKLKEINYRLNWRFGYVYVRVLNKMKKHLQTIFVRTTEKGNSSFLNPFKIEPDKCTLNFNEDNHNKKIEQSKACVNEVECPKGPIDFIFK
ncbi:uncharacterized protein LOC129615611 [Condylostylus longicornis]|uniref:uncharacterized protein LOC129615611 n=1 Tax=Condylostylus longicornis TaxID=2530218 RepID=UPI00244E1DFB|nr:uncharacterized protein LOC129615611 [Condylostylus longicornis]